MRLAGVEKGVNALIAAMGLVIDTLQQQTHLLAELTAAANTEPEGSPVVAAIGTLTGAVERMGEGIDVLAAEMGELPDRLKAVLTGEGAYSLPSAGDTGGPQAS
jgi:hypothetical protein